MRRLKRITVDPQVMGGKPCIRTSRVTVGTIVSLVGAGRTTEEGGTMPILIWNARTSLRLFPTLLCALWK
jgi:hypothetical protein